jgi:2-oxoglutarate ferredoxin oxidoreductase subunit gamma
MSEKIIVAGAGGQGIMIFGQVLAEAAMREHKQVTWLPSYGAEVRGGTAHCMVTISDRPIASPYIAQADTLIIMNQPSLERFKARIKKQGLLILNSSLVNPLIKPKVIICEHPFTDIAIKLGNIKVANMVALGSLLVRKKIVKVKSVIEAIKAIAPEDKKGLIEINLKALAEGMRLK